MGKQQRMDLPAVAIGREVDEVEVPRQPARVCFLARYSTGRRRKSIHQRMPPGPATALRFCPAQAAPQNGRAIGHTKGVAVATDDACRSVVRKELGASSLRKRQWSGRLSCLSTLYRWRAVWLLSVAVVPVLRPTFSGGFYYVWYCWLRRSPPGAGRHS